MNAQCSNCGTFLQREATICPRCSSQTTIQTPSQGIPSAAFQVSQPLSFRAKILYGALAAIIFFLLLYSFSHYLPGGPHPVISQQPEIAMASPYIGLQLSPFMLSEEQIHIRNGTISFDLNIVRDKKFVQFIYHNTTWSEIVLAYISPAGKLVTAIGMCEPCGSTTFSTDETELVSSCGTKWKLDNLEFSGGCGVCQKYPPDPVPSTVVGNEVRIDELLVKNWRRRTS
jgi:RNA polymerase subunit RPABC4/transcription elongation factor Spt4